MPIIIISIYIYVLYVESVEAFYLLYDYNKEYFNTSTLCKKVDIKLITMRVFSVEKLHFNALLQISTLRSW